MAKWAEKKKVKAKPVKSDSEEDEDLEDH